MVSPSRKHAKLNYVNSTSSFEYDSVGAGVHHLPPKQLPRVPFKRYRAGLMFLVAFFTAGAFSPFLPFTVGAFGYFVKPFDSNTCSALFNLGDSSGSDNADTEGPLFYLTLISAWGNFSLATAKSIDVAWDLVIGRGGQALMALICYKVHLEGLIHVMESSSVSYELYTALAFSNTSFVTFIALVKRIFSTRTYLARMLWLLFSTIYIMLFPTFMAALTGYSSIQVCWIVLKNEGGFVPYDEFWSKGELINVTANATESYERIYVYLYNGVNYTDDYYNNRTTFSLITNRYEYGVFPYICIVVVCLHCIWVYGTYGLWVDLNRKSQLSQAGRSVGTYRAVIDLGDALAQDLGTATCAYPEKQLREHLSKKKNLGLKYYQSSNGSTQYIGLTSGNYDGRIDLDGSKGMLFGSKETLLGGMGEA